MSEKFYSAFGQLTAVYARMEGELRLLVAGIAFGDDMVTAAAFLDSSQLSANLAILRKLSRKYWDHYDRLKKLVASIDRIRPRRNQFIHGIWRPGTFDEAGGTAYVVDLKTTYEEKPDSRSWSHSQTEHFSMSDFQSIYRDILVLTKEIVDLMALLESSEGIFFHSGLGGASMAKPIELASDEMQIPK